MFNNGPAKKIVNNRTLIISTVLIAIFFAFFALCYLNCYSFFKPVKISTKILGPYKIAYYKFNGNPLSMRLTSKISGPDVISPFLTIDGLARNIPSFVKRLNTDKIGHYSFIALSFSKTDHLGGFVIKEDSYKLLESLGDSYDVVEIPETKCLFAEYPYKNQSSIFFAGMKILPVLKKELKKKGINNDIMPVIVIYNPDVMYFMTPLVPINKVITGIKQ